MIAFIITYQLLNPQQRSILILRDVLGFSSKETGEILELSVASVNSSLLRARKKLEKEIVMALTSGIDKGIWKMFVWTFFLLTGILALAGYFSI